MPCQICGGSASSYLHSRDTTGFHEYRGPVTPEWTRLIPVPSYMDMEDAVRAMDHSNLAPHFKKTINQMRDALLAAQRFRQ